MALTRPSVTRDLLNAFRASYEAVMPHNIMKQHIKYILKTDTLNIAHHAIPLNDQKLYLVGAGKGVQYLAREFDLMLGPRIEKGIVSIPEGSLDPNNSSIKIQYFEGAKNNLPDKKAESTAKRIKDLVKSLTSNDVLLVLITGGGSALLPLPIEPITLDEKTKLIKALANSGADITELNVVRKRLSDIKGGKLAKSTSAKIITLIISDIVNDPFDLIASGPTVENNDNPQKAIQILKKYDLFNSLPQSIKEVLNKQVKLVSNDIIESRENYMHVILDSNANSKINLVPSDTDINTNTRVLNYIVASNRMSVESAKEHILYLNERSTAEAYVPIIISRSVTGDVKHIAQEYLKLTQFFGDFMKGKLNLSGLLTEIQNFAIEGINPDYLLPQLKAAMSSGKIILILAGETTVEVKGSGKGGRNQQLPLEFSNLLHKHKGELEKLEIYILSAGTDGIDGPTDAAGAIGHTNLISESINLGLDVQEYLNNNDSYNFYKAYQDGKYHIKTGHTNTNVMDIHFIAIDVVQ